MKFHRKKSLIVLTSLLGTLWFGMVGSAWAQYVWLNEKGIKQFSDQPPPLNVPKDRILKTPAARTPSPAKAADEGTVPPAIDTEPVSNSGQPTLAERNADFNKRKKDQADKEKKDAEESGRQSIRQKNCIAAKENQRALESGVRISQVGQNGEREFMTDEQRSKAAQENKRGLDECK